MLVETLDRRTASHLWLSRKDRGKTPFQPEEEEEMHPADVPEGDRFPVMALAGR